MKKQLNESSITTFINKFLDGLQSGTQQRFIDQAKKRGVSSEITKKLTALEKNYIELRKLLNDL